MSLTSDDLRRSHCGRSWNSRVRRARVECRGGLDPWRRFRDLGFRLVRRRP